MNRKFGGGSKTMEKFVSADLTLNKFILKAKALTGYTLVLWFDINICSFQIFSKSKGRRF